MITKPKIIFILASISQPRCLKRIRGFIDNGFVVEIFGFDRGTYNVNAILDNYEIKSLGFADSGSSYFKKIIFARKKLKEIFMKNKGENVIYYSFSFDITLICKISSKKYIYEISDLVYGYFQNKLIRNFFIKLDRFLISRSFLTVMTSAGFKNFLYPVNSLNNIVIQPNKIDSYFHGISRLENRISSDSLTFSYVGAFRYPNTVFRFAEVIGKHYPQHKFLFIGDSILTDQVKNIAANYKNVEYQGQFKNPEDLSEIYAQINIIVAAYDIKTLNEKIAEPNKLYESMFFNRPIIVSKNTYLEEQVIEKYKCGYAIDSSNDTNIKSFIDSLNDNSLNEKVNIIEKIDKEEIIDDNSYEIIKFVTNNYSS